MSTVERVVGGSIERVWTLLTTSESHSRMLDGAPVRTDWRVGRPLTVGGEGPLAGSGVIVELDPPHTLIVTRDGNEHAVHWVLKQADGGTSVAVTDGDDGTADAWADALERLDRLAREPD